MISIQDIELERQVLAEVLLHPTKVESFAQQMVNLKPLCQLPRESDRRRPKHCDHFHN